MPTGTALRAARQLLFDAAERVLGRDGASSLTSRSVTVEAGVAKGVLHRHFADFDDFLAELVLDRLAQLDGQAAELRSAVGRGTVAGNLTASLTALFGPVAVAMVGLVIWRDELRDRLRRAGAARIPLLGEGTAMIAGYLRAEQDLGRIEAGADVDVLAPTLVGAAHLLFTGRDGAPPAGEDVRRMVAAVVGGASPGSG